MSSYPAIILQILTTRGYDVCWVYQSRMKVFQSLSLAFSVRLNTYMRPHRPMTDTCKSLGPAKVRSSTCPSFLLLQKVRRGGIVLMISPFSLVRQTYFSATPQYSVSPLSQWTIILALAIKLSSYQPQTAVPVL